MEVDVFQEMRPCAGAGWGSTLLVPWRRATRHLMPSDGAHRLTASHPSHPFPPQQLGCSLSAVTLTASASVYNPSGFSSSALLWDQLELRSPTLGGWVSGHPPPRPCLPALPSSAPQCAPGTSSRARVREDLATLSGSPPSLLPGPAPSRGSAPLSVAHLLLISGQGSCDPGLKQPLKGLTDTPVTFRWAHVKSRKGFLPPRPAVPLGQPGRGCLGRIPEEDAKAGSWTRPRASMLCAAPPPCRQASPP